MDNKLEFVVLQKGEKRPKAKTNGKGWQTVSNIDYIDDAGILLTNTKDVVVIDFDNLDVNNGIEERVIKEIIKRYGCSLVVKTDKGFHLYYKSSREITKCWTKRETICGVRTDAKTSGNEYLIIKRNGKMREHIGEIRLDNLVELPDVLLPLYKQIDYQMCDLKEGSRNETLFKHLCFIRQCYDETENKIDLEEIANFINEVVFAEPMDKNEVLGIVKSVRNYDIKKNPNFNTKDTKKESEEKEEKENALLNLALELIDEYDIYYHNNELFYKIDNKYVNDNQELLKLAYNKMVFGIGAVEPLLFYIKMSAKKVENENVIRLKNGAIIDNKYVADYSQFSPFYLDIEYNENAYCEDLDKFLNFVSCDKEDIRIIIEEMVGHCLMLDKFPHKFFYLVGGGNNGKTTLVNCLFAFLKNMAVSVPLNMLHKENYIIRLCNKLGNLSDDVDMTYITSSQNLKSLTGEGYIVGRKLYEEPFTFKSKATQIFSSNSLFSSKDKTFGFNRRIEIIPFEAEIKERDPKMLERITTPEAMSYLLNLALKGIERILANNSELSKSEYVDSMIKRYIYENDSVEAFLEFGMDSIEDRKFAYVYISYQKFCEDNDFLPYKKNGFSRKLTSKGYSCYVKKIEDENGIKKSVRYIRKNSL